MKNIDIDQIEIDLNNAKYKDFYFAENDFVRELLKQGFSFKYAVDSITRYAKDGTYSICVWIMPYDNNGNPVTTWNNTDFPQYRTTDIYHSNEEYQNDCLARYTAYKDAINISKITKLECKIANLKRKLDDATQELIKLKGK